MKQIILQKNINITCFNCTKNMNVWQTLIKQPQRTRNERLKPQNMLAEMFSIKKSEINNSSDIINKICQLNWMDYMCLPFEIPKQCNMQQMFDTHYGKNILYYH